MYIKYGLFQILFYSKYNNYIHRLKDIYENRSLSPIQPLFQVTRGQYVSELQDIHGGYPENMSHFGDAYELYDSQTFLAQEGRLDDFFGKCRTQEDMEKNLENDFGFPAYRVWKNTMLLLNPITKDRKTIRPSGRTLLTIPTKEVVLKRY